MPQHHYLHIDDDHLAHTEAFEAVVRLAEATGATPPAMGWHGLTLNRISAQGEQQWLFDELVEVTRRTGVVPELQARLDADDAVFGPAGADPEPLSGVGHSLKLRASYAGVDKELSVPCRYAPIEEELTNDILAHRADACLHSDTDDLIETCRHFRAYLHACVDLVEAFMHRHACWLATAKDATLPETPFPREGDTDQRVAWWLEVFAHARLADLADSQEWSEFQRLQRARRELWHHRAPFLGHSVRDLARQLNLVRDGVGGLLHLLRLLAGQRSLGFIERLRTAPRITFQLPKTRTSAHR